jgi:hypothetical protein
LKRIITAALLSLASFYCAPLVAQTNLSPSPNSAYGVEWDTPNGWYFQVSHQCSTDNIAYGFWPAEPNCRGYFSAFFRNVPYDSPDAGWKNMSIDSENKIRQLSNARDLVVSGLRGDFHGTSAELYHETRSLFLLLGRDPLVMFKGTSYRLQNFSDLVIADLAHNKSEALKIVQEKRRIGLSFFGASLLALFLLYYFSQTILSRLNLARKKVGSIVENFRSRGAKKSKDALDDLRDIQVRRIVRDETIRAATRSSLDTTQKERAELREQISKALDTGNPELAKTLMSLLKKMEGDSV